MIEEPLRGTRVAAGRPFVFTLSLPAWQVSDVLKYMLPCSPTIRLIFVAPLLPVRGLAHDPGGRVLFCSCAFPSGGRLQAA